MSADQGGTRPPVDAVAVLRAYGAERAAWWRERARVAREPYATACEQTARAYERTYKLGREHVHR